MAADAPAAEQGPPVHQLEAPGAGLRRREEHRVAEEEAEAVEAVAAGHTDVGRCRQFVIETERLLREPLCFGKDDPFKKK